MKLTSTILTAAVAVMVAVLARAEDFDLERRCLFEVPLMTGETWLADQPPLNAFGNLLVVRDRRTTTIPLSRVATISPQRQQTWDECASWRALDAGVLKGSPFPMWSSLAPDGWRSQDLVFVYVFWGWCEPCMVSLRHVRDLGSASTHGPRILIVAMDEWNPSWAKAFAKHGFSNGPSMQLRYLAEEPFMRLSGEIKRGSLLGIAFITNGKGIVLHSDVRPPIAVEVTRREMAARARD